MKLLRVIVAVCVLQVGLICVLALRTSRINAENRELIFQSSPSNPKPIVALESLEKENSRLKSELATIPDLSRKVQELQKVSAEESAKASEFWTQRSNMIESAIAKTKDEIRAIEDWGQNFDRAKLRERAAARLAQKAAAGAKTPEEVVAGYARTQEILQTIATRTAKMREVRQQWQASEKKPENRAEFKRNMDAAWSGLDAAVKMLGDDSELFEQLPAPPENADLSKMPFYRSLIPDLHGVTATLYFDGTVAWSPPLTEALAKIK
jgi:hypothetical protein